MSISPVDFTFICEIVKKHSGLSLSDEKKYLVNARLLPLAKRLGFEGISELVSTVKMGGRSDILIQINEAMTTNETSFFRDIRPFEQFKNIIFPHIKKHNKNGQIKIWCSACSTGQEPYSLAITILNNPDIFGDYSFSIIATDINKKVLAKAREGIYSQFEVQRGLPIADLTTHFDRNVDSGEKWQIKNNIRNMIKFDCLNLMDNFSSIGKFDVIFCRNVLIYFEPDTKKVVLEKLSKCLNPNGLVLLGSSETANDYSELKAFDEVRGAYYI